MKNEVIQYCISGVGGFAVFLVGGFDTLFTSILVLMGCDFLTGTLANLKSGKFSTNICLWGIVNKVVTIFVIIGVHFIQKSMNLELPLRESVIMLLIINETLSMLRNASTFVAGLEPLTKYFEATKIKIFRIFEIGE